MQRTGLRVDHPRRRRWRGGLSLLVVAWLGLGVLLDVATAQASRRAARAAAEQIRVQHHPSRSLRVRLNIPPEDRRRLQRVELWVSDDWGSSWSLAKRAAPDQEAFPVFTAQRDAEYWFTTRTLDTRGRRYPGDDEPIVPRIRVAIDTTDPTIQIYLVARRGNAASIRWEVHDEYIDLETLQIEYQIRGARQWRAVPLQKALSGKAFWNAGSPLPLVVRGRVADKAGNAQVVRVDLPDGTHDGRRGPLTADNSDRPPSTPFGASRSFDASTRADLPAMPEEVAEPAPSRPELQNDPSDPLSNFLRRPTELPNSRPPITPEFDAPGFTEENASAPGFRSLDGDEVPGFSDRASRLNKRPGLGEPPRATTPEGFDETAAFIADRAFPLRYAVEDAGPNGPARVQMWVTRDDGLTWRMLGDDPDRQSPFPIQLPEEGRFGLRLVAQSASGLGDAPPVSGDQPDFTVHVDTTPPRVVMLDPLMGQGAYEGSLMIRWQVSDQNLDRRPITIQYRLDRDEAPWRTIVEDQENGPSYIWPVPAEVSGPFHIRVLARDRAGNQGSDQTRPQAPIVLDRSRPRGRILGLGIPKGARDNRSGGSIR